MGRTFSGQANEPPQSPGSYGRFFCLFALLVAFTVDSSAGVGREEGLREGCWGPWGWTGQG